MIEIKRLVQDITFSTEAHDKELAKYLTQGWEILDISTTSIGHNKDDGFYRQYVTQVIMLRRTVTAEPEPEAEQG